MANKDLIKLIYIYISNLILYQIIRKLRIISDNKISKIKYLSNAFIYIFLEYMANSIKIVTSI